MTRTLAIPCLSDEGCGRKFGGQETFERHRYIAGDRYECRTARELERRGFYQDRFSVWHRGANPGQTSLLGPTENDREAHPAALLQTGLREDFEFSDPYPSTLYNGSPPSEPVSTSEAAAASMKPIATTMRDFVLAAIRRRGSEGATDDELEEVLGMRHQTLSARRRELVLLGLIHAIGERRTRSGRRAKVWAAR